MQRFFVRPEDVQADQVTLPEHCARQIHDVLRMRPGAQVAVFDGSGLELTVELTEIAPARALGRVLARRLAPGEPRVHLTLYPAWIKRDNLEWVLQKGTELGVGAFVPVVSQRTVLRKAEDMGSAKRARWQRIIIEAAEQSQRARQTGSVLYRVAPAALQEIFRRLPLAQIKEGLRPVDMRIEGCGGLPLIGICG